MIRSNGTTGCRLCDPRLSPVLAEGTHWRLVLNRNQNLLGKCFLTVRRHVEAVADLTPEEWLDLQPELQRATRALTTTFRPDHFNYAFLQNQDRHVHLHIIPRYAAPRSLGATVFVDPDYPDHYAVPGQVRDLDQDLFAALATRLSQALAAIDS
jgi:diadenosine tetraphosphate (Ap4A) HIT family hydrolase